jgi:hypothetical protein
MPVGPAPTIKTGFVVIMLKLDTDISENVNNNVDVTIGESAAPQMENDNNNVHCCNSSLTV